VPTVIICGTEDVLTSIGHSRKMASRIHGVELVEVPDAGHMVILEASRQVNAAIDRMLSQTTVQGTQTR
jgi:pimeloyl-ACP methyl ester carboxylesterase